MSDTFIWREDRGLTSNTTLDISEVQFSDGYVHRAQRSLNPEKTIYNLTFINRTVEQINEIVTFLKSKGGYIAFLWSPSSCPETASSINVVCKTWDKTTIVDGHVSLSTTFEIVSYGIQRC